MRLQASPGRPLLGEATLPGDKSISHRAALFAALAEGESQIENFLVAGVTQALLNALRDLGTAWSLADSTLRVRGAGLGGFRSPHQPLDCGNSATTLRLLAGACAAAGSAAVLDGTPGLRRRPMLRIVRPLTEMGVAITTTDQGTAPLTLAGRPPTDKLHPIDTRLAVASAQVKTCLLLAGLAAAGPTTIREPGPSRDHSERMLASMGASVTRENSPRDADEFVTRIAPLGARGLTPLQLRVPGDFSAAAFLIVAALITPGSAIRLPRVGINPTRTGLLDALRQMGAAIEITHRGTENGEEVADLAVRYSPLKGTEISGPLVVRMIDEFPAFAAAAAYAAGETRVLDAAELRYKESDRISVLCQEFQKLGIEIVEAPDGFTLTGGRLPAGGACAAHGDHRLAMALSLIGLAANNPVRVEGAEVVAESFPDFAAVLKDLGASIQVQP